MATRDIVPRADNEGGIGNTLKKWATGFINALTVASIKITTGAGAGKLLTSDADGDASWGITLAAPGPIGETTPDTIRGLSKEIIKTESGSLSAAEVSGTIVTIYGMTNAALVLTLPTIASGMAFMFVIADATYQATRAINLRAATNDLFYLSGTAGSNNGYVGIASGYAVANCISVTAFQTGATSWDWLAIPVVGTWVAS